MLFQPNETVISDIEIYNSSNVLTAPDTITITITDPGGTKRVDGGTPSNSSTGKYSYNYDVPSSPVKGRWVVEWKVTKSSIVTIARDYFEVEA
jgi:hypothetical protein